jgi:hypothetical protein
VNSDVQFSLWLEGEICLLPNDLSNSLVHDCALELSRMFLASHGAMERSSRVMHSGTEMVHARIVGAWRTTRAPSLRILVSRFFFFWGGDFGPEWRIKSSLIFFYSEVGRSRHRSTGNRKSDTVKL